MCAIEYKVNKTVYMMFGKCVYALGTAAAVTLKKGPAGGVVVVVGRDYACTFYQIKITKQ